MRRTIFTEEHEQFRQLPGRSWRRNASRTPRSGSEAGVVSREAWRKAGEPGLLGWEVPEEYGGIGIRDFRYNAIIAEEIAATGTQGIGLGAAQRRGGALPDRPDQRGAEGRAGCRAS